MEQLGKIKIQVSNGPVVRGELNEKGISNNTEYFCLGWDEGTNVLLVVNDSGRVVEIPSYWGELYDSDTP